MMTSDARKRDDERRAAERAVAPESPVSTRSEGVDMEATITRVATEHCLEQGAGGLHLWRCDYPDRYGECDCLAEFVADLTAALSAPVPDVAAERVAAKWADLWGIAPEFKSATEADEDAIRAEILRRVADELNQEPDSASAATGTAEAVRIIEYLRDLADATDGGVSRAATTPDQQGEGGER